LNTQLFINGIWQDSESEEKYTMVNPANPDEVLGEFQRGDVQDSKKAIDAAEEV
jgi:aldehyde dehydrogenase (NAD+)